MIFRQSKCVLCGKEFCDGESVIHLMESLFCENCISENTESYEPEDSALDDLVDEMKDARNGW